MSISIHDLRIGLHVRHPRYGAGVVKALTEHTADITFDDTVRTVDPALSDLTVAGPTASLTELQMPLAALIRQTAQAMADALGLEPPEQIVDGLANRWQSGKLVLRPADSSLQAKEVPIETFFHKIVMIRNNLRVLEQKVNASEKLSDADKFDLQQYITRCYGSLTTFNVLFKEKEDQFGS
jgi:hypothetical protein